jgi:DNA polymerase-3 subunit alpha
MMFFSPHTHCTFSFGDGYGTPEDHAVRLAELGATGAALTDHGNITGHAQWEKALTKHGLHPAFGCELYLAPPGELRKWHLTVIAENLVGYRNLCQLVSRSWAEGFYKYPTVHSDMLADHAEGLVVTSGCADSLLACTLLGGKSYGEQRATASADDVHRAVQVVEWFQDLFGDGYYLECQRFPELERCRTLNEIYAAMSGPTGVPLVATADVHYPLPEQNTMQTTLHAAMRGSTVEAQEAGWEYSIKLSHPLSDQQITDQLIETGLTKHQAELAVASSEEIGQRCQVVLPKSESVKYPGIVEELVW